MSRRKANSVAKDLRTPKYRQRVEAPRKGKGSYNRGIQQREDRAVQYPPEANQNKEP